MTAANPFFHRGPVRDPAYFFGRATELQTIAELLQQGQSVAIHGPRRMGKTSLLFQLLHPTVATNHRLDSATIRWAYLDGGQIDGLGEEWLYGAIDQALGGTHNTLPYTEFIADLRSLAAKGQRLIVALDEFELIAGNPQLGLAVFNRLRALAAQYPLQFITASRDALAEISFAHPATLSSPFFNIFAAQQLGFLDDQAASDLLTQLSAQAGVPFSPEVIATLLQSVGPHPLFLQIAGYRMYTASIALSDGIALNKEYTSQIQQPIASDLYPHLAYAWALLSSEQQCALAALPLEQLQPQPDMLRRLTQSGWLNRNNYPGTLIEQFVRQQRVKGILQHRLCLLDQRRGMAATKNGPLHLTPTEYAALQFFLEHAGQIVTLEQLEAALWPGEYSTDPERARGVLKKLRAALGEAGEAIVNRRGQGWILI